MNNDSLEEREQLVVSLRQRILETIKPEMTQQAYEVVNGSDAYRRPQKDVIRSLYSEQKLQALARLGKSLKPAKVQNLIRFFATGAEIDPVNIEPELVEVEAGTTNADLFRLATAQWSVPPTAGYGRRMRWLVFDRYNDKLIGLFALCDPVIGLSTRDQWIGWDTAQKGRRLSAVMSAYAVGSVPPYSHILGGKLVTALLSSHQVSEAFKSKYLGRNSEYAQLTGKPPKFSDGILALIMITSAFGRSSLYNRVQLPGLVSLEKIGATKGWGHFQIEGDVFRDMRRLLKIENHPYAKGYEYGNGANWRMRLIRQALSSLEVDQDLLRHRIYREVYGMPMGTNWRNFLLGKADQLEVTLPEANVISKAAKERWILPRAVRRPDYQDWNDADIAKLFAPLLTQGRLSH